MHAKLIRFSWVLSAIFLVTSGYAAIQHVPIDYPGLFFWEDTELPGTPGGSKEDYVKELVSWGARTVPSIPLTKEIVHQYIEQAYDPGLSQSVAFRVQGQADQVVFDVDASVLEAMKDVVFLETAQRSVNDWKKNYFLKIGSGAIVSLSEAYDRALQIQEEVLDVNTVLKRVFFSLLKLKV